MGDMGDDFAALRDHNRLQREQRREANIPRIEDLEAHGFQVQRLTPYHYRVGSRLDFFPTSMRWHNLTTKQRGSYRGQSPVDVAREQFPHLFTT